MNNPSPILNLPPEIIHKTLILVKDPIDVLASFSSTCRDLYEFCKSATLHRELFLVNYDPPSVDVSATEAAREGDGIKIYDYGKELKVRTTGLLWFKSEDSRKRLQLSPPSILEETLLTILSIAQERLSTSQDSLNSTLLNESITPDMLHYLRPPTPSRRQLRSSTPPTPPLPSSTLSLLSQLQVLSSPSPLTLHSPSHRTRARETVYARSNFNKSSHYGPFKNDKSGNVDWNKLEALSIVMGCNLRDSDWDEPQVSSTIGRNGVETVETLPLEIPKGWDSTREVEPVVNAKGEINERDWAGVERELSGTYSFLDYRVFEHYNHSAFNSPIGSLETESEAVGDRMVLKLKLLPADHVPEILPGSRRSMEFDSDDDEEDEDFEGVFSSGDEEEGEGDAGSGDEGSFNFSSEEEEGLIEEAKSSPTTSTTSTSTTSTSTPVASLDTSSTPTLSFIGTSTPLNFSGSFSTIVPTHMSNRSIRGSVKKTPEGDIAWTMIIRYSGADRWLMSGVQIGKSRSQFGILGTWSTAENDPDGPHGPFMYWPTRNDA